MVKTGTVGDYIVTGRIGSGSFAVVYKGYHRKTRLPVAVKAINRERLNAKLQENLESEISIMQHISHPNIVQLYEIKKTEKHIYLILEYCGGGDLQKFIRSKKVLSEEVARHFLNELAKGLAVLWSRNLIHRDLKPQNLLLTENSSTANIKIADFGFARHLEVASMAETLCGSPLYMAPEILRFQKYDAKADLWSVGTILFEMVVGRPPFGGSNHVQLLANIERNELRFPSSITISNDCLSLLQTLLQRNPMMRCSFEDFFQTNFVQIDYQKAIQEGIEIYDKTNETESCTADQVKFAERKGVENENDEAARVKKLSLQSSFVGMSRQVSSKPQSIPHMNRGSNPGMAFSPPSKGFRRSNDDNSSFQEPQARSAPTDKYLSRERGAMLDSAETKTVENSSQAVHAETKHRGLPRRRTSFQLSPNNMAQLEEKHLTFSNSTKGRNFAPSSAPNPRTNPFKEASSNKLARGAKNTATPGSSLSKPKGEETAFIGNRYSNENELPVNGVGATPTEDYVFVETSSPNSSPTIAKASFTKSVVTNCEPFPSPSTTTTNTSLAHCLNNQCLSSGVKENTRFKYEIERKSESCNAALSNSSNVLVFVETVGKRAQAVAQLGDQLAVTALASFTTLGLDSEGSAPAAKSMPSPKKNSSHDSYCLLLEAFELYVKSMEIFDFSIQNLVSLLQSHSCSNSSVAEGQMALLWLVDQFSRCLNRSKQCHSRIRSVEDDYSTDRSKVKVDSAEELIFVHALELGQEGAVKEMLSQNRSSMEYYAQAKLLLETLCMEKEVTDSDHSVLNQYISGFNSRIETLKTTLM